MRLLNWLRNLFRSGCVDYTKPYDAKQFEEDKYVQEFRDYVPPPDYKTQEYKAKIFNNRIVSFGTVNPYINITGIGGYMTASGWVNYADTGYNSNIGFNNSRL
jgi:hypothetical protein